MSYLKDVLPVGLDMSYVEQVKISLEQNVAVLNDNYLGLSPSLEEWLQFYQVDSAQFSSFIDTTNLLAEYSYVQSAVYKQYDRTVYNLLDMLTSLGGLFSSLSVLGMSFGKVFGYNLMLSSMIRKLYHFKPRFEEEVKKKKDKKKKGGKKKNKEKAVDEATEATPLKPTPGTNADDGGDDDIMQTQFRLFSDKVN